MHLSDELRLFHNVWLVGYYGCMRQEVRLLYVKDPFKSLAANECFPIFTSSTLLHRMEIASLFAFSEDVKEICYIHLKQVLK